MLRVYGDIFSGNCYKIKLLLSYLEQEHQWIHLSLLEGETQLPQFLALNPQGKVPVLRLDDGRLLSESNAILNYLGDGSEYLPSDPYERALVLKWQFFEQYSHEPYIATSRFIVKYLGKPADRLKQLADNIDPGNAALILMDQQLSQTPFITGDTLTIADISLYAYTHVAEEGEFDLSSFAYIQLWLKRVEAHPRHISMAEANKLPCETFSAV